MEAERDLAEDAQWKKIQQNTFTRWANEYLKTIEKNIDNLETDLSDGLRLIALIEILSQKRMGKHNKRPTFRSQKLENVSVALKFLEEEGIKIVNIGESQFNFKSKSQVKDTILCHILTKMIVQVAKSQCRSTETFAKSGHLATRERDHISSLAHILLCNEI
jgi:hypothetical protein